MVHGIIKKCTHEGCKTHPFIITKERQKHHFVEYIRKMVWLIWGYEWCKTQPPCEGLSCALTLKSIFAEYVFAYPHSRKRGLVKTSKPHTPWLVIDTSKYGWSTRSRGTVYGHVCSLGVTLSSLLRCILLKKKSELNKSKGVFPFRSFFLLRAEVTWRSELWHVLTSYPNILTIYSSTHTLTLHPWITVLRLPESWSWDC
jgi:hypothetical protein